ncbi:Olfactory receptor 2A25 [Collichthys lucidus]|uniref:Olfactory receptor 2A25 n=1 Tax=Collichthys lucidus TaxID=240159 RepID=A0A4U5TVR7_COLLU|nr:Olfactory receptor 2A25 [Collichthys lucidus]
MRKLRDQPRTTQEELVADLKAAGTTVTTKTTDILRPPSERLISYYACVFQAFITQLFGATSHTVLMIMAFDRYVAICYPLRYSTIMTNKMVMKLTVSAWGSAFVLVGILIGLTTVQELSDALVQIWEEILQDTILHLIRSIPDVVRHAYKHVEYHYELLQRNSKCKMD